MANFEETTVVLQGYLELLIGETEEEPTSEKKEAEAREVRLALSEVTAMKLQVLH